MRRFLHLYAGSQDVLVEAIVREANKQNTAVEATSMDLATGTDLTCPERHRTLLQQAISKGSTTGRTPGFPAAPFPGYDGSKPQHIYALPSNTAGSGRQRHRHGLFDPGHPQCDRG